MRPYHSTDISMLSRHCPAALGFREAGVPEDRSVYAVGVAAHAVLEGVQAKANEANRELSEDEIQAAALGICERLIAVGRSYDGKPEPPSAPEATFAGRNLALDWLLTDWPPVPGVMVEQGLGLDAQGQPCDYWSDGAAIRTILDYVRLDREADEESARTVLVVRDYKSAWPTDESELDTLQRKIQAIAAWRYFGPTDVLRMEVASLRLQKIHEREYYAEDGLDALLADWWSDIVATTGALEAQRRLGPRPAAPGRGCIGCPFLSACPHAQDYIERRGMHQTAKERAIAYAVATAMREDLAELLRLDTEDGVIAIPAGVVGTVAKEQKRLREDGYSILYDRWVEMGGEALGMLKALDLGSGNAVKMARVLHADRSARAQREALIDEVTEPKIVREFGIHPPPQSNS